jgi:ribonuclease E
MLRSIRNQQRIGGDRKPEVTWQEAREEEEEEIEDVRYLLGNGVNEASDDDMAESEDEDEIVGLDDTKIMNGIEEENSSDESIDVPTKVNGISHDSDSDDAVDLDDLIDDEAEETSDDDDEEEEGEEEEEDDDDENSDVPRPKKPKLR